MIRALYGAPVGAPTDQILPPGMPGYRQVGTYPLVRPDFQKAKKILAGAGKRCGRVRLYSGAEPNWLSAAHVLARNWRRIGCRVVIKAFGGESIHTAVNRRNAFDAALTLLWGADFVDPADFIDLFANGQPAIYLNERSLDRQIHAADRMSGAKRIRAFQRLNAQITVRYAPWVSLYNFLGYWFFSTQVRGVVSQPYSANRVVDLAALSLK
jgi:ABC-type transport system substrate-binding protein